MENLTSFLQNPFVIAILILIVGFLLAKFISGLIARLISKTGVDEKLSHKMKLSRFVGKLLYYLLMIIVLFAALNIIGVGSDIMNPFYVMLSEFFGAVPNIIVAGIIIYIGYFLARFVSELVEMSGDTIKGWLPKLNMKESVNLVKVLKTIVFIFIFIPAVIIGLEKLNFSVITDPATGMLEQFMLAIPKILYATIIILVTFIGGRIVVNLLKDLLNGLNVNDIGEKLKLQKVIAKTNVVNLIGNLAFFLIVYFGLIEALKQLELYEVVDIMKEVLMVAGNILLGLLILALGNFVANFAVQLFDTENTSKLTLSILKGAILIIFLAMGLNAMNIADEIVNLAFGLGIGAIAVAFALAFGLGGKEAASQEIKDFFKKLKK